MTLAISYTESFLPILATSPTTLDTTIIFPYHIISLYPRSTSAYIGVPLQNQDITADDAEIYRIRGFTLLVQSAEHTPLYPCDELCRSRWRTLDDSWGFGLFCWRGLNDDAGQFTNFEYPYPFTPDDISSYRWTIGGACLNITCPYYNVPFSTYKRENPCVVA
jgi:hypothetical protein